MSSTILAIAAHPGDAVFTMGATVAQHIHNGGNGVFLSLSLGERGCLSGFQYTVALMSSPEQQVRSG